MNEPKTSFWAKCAKCNHTWLAAYLPMEITAFAKLAKGLCCPMCGAGSKDLRTAPQEDGVLKEAVHAESGAV